MKVLVAFSGGKDSHASLIHSVKKYGAKNTIAVFCDTQWEHALLYPFIDEVCAELGVELVTLKSEYSFLELAEKKGRFPSTKAKFCSETLKVKPMIDFVIEELETNDYLIVVQGIRADESKARSSMDESCQYFKYYFTPYGYDKHKKPKYFSYRKKDIVKLNGLGRVDIERPFFNATAQDVVGYILEAEQKPNPLYYLGLSRVGCFPCIMARHSEIMIMIETQPEYCQRLIDAEIKTGRSFFPPKYIPEKYADKKDAKGNRWASAERVFEYIKMKNSQGEMFEDENVERSCMSAFNICE